MKNRRILPVLLAVLLAACGLLSLASCEREGFTETAEEALTLSAEGGVYAEEFTLYVAKVDKSHTIYYTSDGSGPTADSEKYNPRKGISIKDVSESSKYKLTDAVTTSGYGGFTYGKFCAGTPLRFLETDEDGNAVAEKCATYIVVTDASLYASLSAFPVVCLTAPRADWTGADGIYNNPWEEDLSIRAELEYYDAAKGESFSRNTKVSVGGGWTKGYPQRTLNLNYKRDENGEKNQPVSVDLFDGRQRRDGAGALTSFTRMRLHNGGNGIGGLWFSDALTQRIAENSYASTTAYRPCSVFLNGEYWGLYALREQYSAEYFHQNYGVDEDEVVYVDRRAGYAEEVTIGGKSYTTYGFAVKEYDEAAAYTMLDELFTFLQNADWTDEDDYAAFEEMVDVDSFLDCVLVAGYVCNWDFLYNNLRMWRTASTDENNPYADGKWRFCLHDEDFSFNEVEGQNGLSAADRAAGKSYFDFYVGNAYMDYSAVGYIAEPLHRILSAPLQSETFRGKMAKRAYEICEMFEPAAALETLEEMWQEISSLYRANMRRWNMQGYNKESWANAIANTAYCIQNRRDYFLSELRRAYGLDV